jgi:hypothetical protein
MRINDPLVIHLAHAIQSRCDRCSRRPTAPPAELECAGILLVAFGTCPACLLGGVRTKLANRCNGSIAVLISIDPDLRVRRASVASRFNYVRSNSALLQHVSYERSVSQRRGRKNGFHTGILSSAIGTKRAVGSGSFVENHIALIPLFHDGTMKRHPSLVFRQERSFHH